MAQESQDFYLQNPWPEPKDLVKYAENQLHIEKNEEHDHKISLFFLLKKFRDFIQKDLNQSNHSFWVVDEPQDGRFPLEELRSTLNNFLKDRVLWACETIDNNYKHEHFAVLFFIAALRYVKFPPPVRQIKFEEKKGQNPRIDLFFFDRKNQEDDKAAAFALQVVILAKKDISENMRFKDGSFRAERYKEKGLFTFEDLRQYSIDVGSAFAYGYCESLQPTTKYFVVHICPYKVTWDECGLYDEDITPEFQNLEDLASNVLEKEDQISEEDQDIESKFFNRSKNFLGIKLNKKYVPSKGGKNLLMQKSLKTNKNERLKEDYKLIPSQSPLSKPFKAPCSSLASTQKDDDNDYNIQSSSSSQASIRNQLKKLSLEGKDSVTFKVEDCVEENEEESISKVRRRNGFRTPFKLLE